jgi:hypothetical protein
MNRVLEARSSVGVGQNAPKRVGRPAVWNTVDCRGSVRRGMGKSLMFLSA